MVTKEPTKVYLCELIYLAVQVSAYELINWVSMNDQLGKHICELCGTRMWFMVYICICALFSYVIILLLCGYWILRVMKCVMDKCKCI